METVEGVSGTSAGRHCFACMACIPWCCCRCHALFPLAVVYNACMGERKCRSNHGCYSPSFTIWSKQGMWGW